MEVFELRLGNIIEQGIVHQIRYNKGTLGVDVIKSILTPNYMVFIPECDLRPKFLTKEILSDHGFSISEKIKGKYGDIWIRGFLDYNICLERDWRGDDNNLSFHMGIEYTDSPHPEDENVIYNFTHKVDSLHRLQNLFQMITKEGDGL